MIKKIYTIDQIEREWIRDELWNSENNCQFCRNNPRAVKYYDPKIDELHCEHNYDFYLLDKNELNSILKYGPSNVSSLMGCYNINYKFKNHKIYKIITSEWGPPEEKMVYDLTDNNYKKRR